MLHVLYVLGVKFTHRTTTKKQNKTKPDRDTLRNTTDSSKWSPEKSSTKPLKDGGGGE